jgi:hypothetical protein
MNTKIRTVEAKFEDFVGSLVCNHRIGTVGTVCSEPFIGLKNMACILVKYPHGKEIELLSEVIIVDKDILIPEI